MAELEEIQSWNCKDSSSGTFLLLNGICQPTFIISLLYSEKLLTYTLPISIILQTAVIDFSTAVNQIESVVSILCRFKSNAENEFKELFLEAQQVASNLDFAVSILDLQNTKLGDVIHNQKILKNIIDVHYSMEWFVFQ